MEGVSRDDWAVVEEALIFARDCGDRPGMGDEAERALHVLARLREREEQLRDSVKEYQEQLSAAEVHITKAEARVAEFEKDWRDQARRHCEQIARLEAALREITEMRGTPEARTGRWHERARHALDAKEG